MVVPAQVTDIDTAEFCNLLEISVSSFRDRMNAAINLFKKSTVSFSEADFRRIIRKAPGENVFISRILCSAKNIKKIFKTNSRSYAGLCKRG